MSGVIISPSDSLSGDTRHHLLLGLTLTRSVPSRAVVATVQILLRTSRWTNVSTGCPCTRGPHSLSVLAGLTLVARMTLHSFSCLSNIPLYGEPCCIYPFSFGGPLVCFHFLAVMNNAAVNMYKFLCGHSNMFSFLLGMYLEEFLGHMLTLRLTFRGTAGIFQSGCVI